MKCMKKRFVILLMALIIALYPLAFANATDNEKTHLANDSISLLALADSCVKIGTELYFNAETRLYRWNGRTESPVLVMDGIQGQLIGNAESLFILNLSERTLTRLAEEEAGERLVLCEAYPLDSPKLLNADGSLKRLLAATLTGGRLFLLVESADPLQTDVLSFSLSDGWWKAMERQSAHAITAYRDGTVLLASYDITGMRPGCELLRYDAASGKKETLCTFDSLQPEALTFCPERGLICAEENGIVYAFDMRMRPVPIAQTSASATSAYTCLMGDTYVSLRSGGGIEAVVVDMDGIEPVVLTFTGSMGIHDEMNPAFSQAHPDVIIQDRKDPLGSDYAIQLITNVNAADIYTFHATSPEYYAVISKGYGMDLSHSKIIMGEVASFYPFLAEALFAPDGALVAVPVGNIWSPILYEYYTDAWQRAEMGEIPTTAGELLDICMAFSERDDLLDDDWRFSMNSVDLNRMKQEMLQMLIQAYIAEFSTDEGYIEMDTPVFRGLLKKYEDAFSAMQRITMETKAYPPGGYDWKEAAQTCLLSHPGAELLPEYDPGVESAFLPLTVTKGIVPSVEVDVAVFVINPSSPNRDLALEYLEMHVKNLDDHKRIQYIPKEAEPVQRDIYDDEKTFLTEKEASLLNALENAAPDASAELKTQLEAVHTELIELEKRRFSTTKKMIEKYKQLAETMRINRDTGLNFFMKISYEMSSLLNQYVQGAIDRAQFITRYDAMAQMVYFENSTD